MRRKLFTVTVILIPKIQFKQLSLKLVISKANFLKKITQKFLNKIKWLSIFFGGGGKIFSIKIGFRDTKYKTSLLFLT